VPAGLLLASSASTPAHAASPCSCPTCSGSRAAPAPTTGLDARGRDCRPARPRVEAGAGERGHARAPATARPRPGSDGSWPGGRRVDHPRRWLSLPAAATRWRRLQRTLRHLLVDAGEGVADLGRRAQRHRDDLAPLGDRPVDPGQDAAARPRPALLSTLPAKISASPPRRTRQRVGCAGRTPADAVVVLVACGLQALSPAQGLRLSRGRSDRGATRRRRCRGPRSRTPRRRKQDLGGPDRLQPPGAGTSSAALRQHRGGAPASVASFISAVTRRGSRAGSRWGGRRRRRTTRASVHPIASSAAAVRKSALVSASTAPRDARSPAHPPAACARTSATLAAPPTLRRAARRRRARARPFRLHVAGVQSTGMPRYASARACTPSRPARVLARQCPCLGEAFSGQA